MRNFILTSFSMIVDAIVIIMLIGVVLSTLTALFSPYFGFFSALITLIGGLAAVALTAGSLYLLMGIYEHSKRTAEATEALLRR